MKYYIGGVLALCAALLVTYRQSKYSWRLFVSNEVGKTPITWDLVSLEFFTDVTCDPKSKIHPLSEGKLISSSQNTDEIASNEAYAFNNDDSSWLQAKIYGGENYWIGIQFNRAFSRKRRVECVHVLQRDQNYLTNIFIQEKSGKKWKTMNHAKMGPGWSAIFTDKSIEQETGGISMDGSNEIDTGSKQDYSQHPSLAPKTNSPIPKEETESPSYSRPSDSKNIFQKDVGSDGVKSISTTAPSTTITLQPTKERTTGDDNTIFSDNDDFVDDKESFNVFI